MKKKLIALAALAFVGAASAQSSVTVYGRVDMGVTKEPGSGAKLDASNGMSRLGFTGVEDMGGGLKATFKLETRISPESGGQDGSTGGRPFWQGESTVGLANGLGAIRLGRAQTAYRNVSDVADPWATERVATTQGATVVSDLATGNGGGANRTDGIFLTSSDFSGFKFAASYGFKQQAPSIVAATVRNPKNSVAAAGWYAAGPIVAGIGYEQNRRGDDGYTVAGTYDFGIVKIGAGYVTTDTTVIGGDDYKGYQLSAAVPFGAFLFRAGYLGYRVEGPGTKGHKLGLGLDYALSKRTSIYSAYGKSGGDAVTGNASKASYEVGVKHTF